MEQSKKNIFIITGETSGDMHGAELIKSIKEKRNDITFSGIGGELLKDEGVNLIHNFSEINFIGFSSVIKNYAKIKSVLNDTIEYIMRTNPDILILVDFPGFNLKIKSLGTEAKYLSNPVKTVNLLGYNGKLEWQQQADGLSITCPAAMPFETSIVFKIE